MTVVDARGPAGRRAAGVARRERRTALAQRRHHRRRWHGPHVRSPGPPPPDGPGERPRASPRPRRLGAHDPPRAARGAALRCAPLQASASWRRHRPPPRPRFRPPRPRPRPPPTTTTTTTAPTTTTTLAPTTTAPAVAAPTTDHEHVAAGDRARRAAHRPCAPPDRRGRVALAARGGLLLLGAAALELRRQAAPRTEPERAGLPEAAIRSSS